MSFRKEALVIRQSDTPFIVRHLCFRHCVQFYAELRRGSFNGLYQHFADKFGFNEKVPDATERLVKALDEMEFERRQIIEKMRVFDLKRVRAKTRGRRTLSNVEREKLEAIQQGK